MKTILLVEDDEDDILLVQRAFRQARIPHSLQTVSNGQEADDYLSGIERYASRETYPFPALILLDLKTPKHNGHELLYGIRARAGMALLPVIVFSGSTHPVDIESAYRLGANSYLIKPVHFERLVEILPVVIQYWLEINTSTLE